MPWSCTCGDLSSQFIEIREAARPGWCAVTVPLTNGYNLNLPDNWYCSIAGAGANNLSCSTEHNQRIFLQSLTSDLPITEADSAISVFQEGEGYYSDPIVGPDEEKVSREMKAIGDKQVIKLLTKQEDSFILRYFIKNNDNLYVFIVESQDLVGTKDMTVLLEEIINSMQFVR